MQPSAPFAPYPHPAYRQPPPEEPPPRLRAFQAITFAFRGEDSLVSILTGVVYMMIPIVGPIALLGYQTEIFRRLARRDPRPLPKLTFAPFTAYLTRGVVPFVAQLLFALPFTFVGIFVFVSIVGATLVASTHGTGAGPAQSAIFAAMLLPWTAMMVAWIGLAPVLQSVLTRAALTEEVAKTFDFRALLAYARSTYWPSALSLLAFGIFAFGLYLLGAAMCFVGIWPILLIVQIAATHLRWQTYEFYLARGGEPVPMKPEPALPQAAWGAPG